MLNCTVSAPINKMRLYKSLITNDLNNKTPRVGAIFSHRPHVFVRCGAALHDFPLFPTIFPLIPVIARTFPTISRSVPLFPVISRYKILQLVAHPMAVGNGIRVNPSENFYAPYDFLPLLPLRPIRNSSLTSKSRFIDNAASSSLLNHAKVAEISPSALPRQLDPAKESFRHRFA